MDAEKKDRGVARQEGNPEAKPPDKGSGSARSPAGRMELAPEAWAALDAGVIGLWRWEIGSGNVSWTGNLDRIHGLPPGTFNGTYQFFLDDIHPEDRDGVVATIERAIKSGGAYHVQYRVKAAQGGERWVEGRGTVVIGEGGASVMTGICHDVTEKHLVERELQRRLLEQETVAALGRMALGEASLPELFNEAVRLVHTVLDVELTKILELLPSGDELLVRAGIGWRDGVVGHERVGSDPGTQAGYALRSDLPVIVKDLAGDARFQGPSLLLDHGVVSGLSVVIRGRRDRPFGVFGAHTRRKRKFSVNDVNFIEAMANILASAIHRAEEQERMRLVLREMRHRSGNLLAIVTSIASRTAERATSVEEFGQKLRNRLVALADTHALIMQGGWTSTSLAALLDTSLWTYREQVGYAGGHVELNADMAFALGMVIHELATNASKYGSLSFPSGRVTVQWRVAREGEGKILVLTWRETGRTAKAATGTATHGFGTRLIRSIVEQQLGGSIDRQTGEGEFAITFRLPLREPVAPPVSS